MNGFVTGAATAAQGGAEWSPQEHAGAVLPAPPAPWAELLAELCECGRRGAPPERAMAALQRYWLCVAASTRVERAQLAARLQESVRSGLTAPRAWLPVALGEPDFGLARAAVAAYGGTLPCSLERRARAIDDAIDWLRRGLGLNRAATFAGLLDLAEPTVLERLAGLRSLLEPAAAFEVLSAPGLPRDDATLAFLDEWAARLA
jgi:hypothetical protein